jgi:hypothetical protein
MKIKSTPRIRSRWFLIALMLTTVAELASAATYQVGYVVTNFTLVARRPFTRPDGTAVPAGARVNLHDFSGRIVFLEWFAVWCPYCVAAAPQVNTGIVDYYSARGGNPYGVPVLHIAVNQEPNASYQGQTDNFITQQGFDPVVNDYGPGLGTNRVRFLFQNSGQPLFVVINGVTNSPTHQPWQLLVNHLGYGQTDFNQTLAGFRAIINTVQSPAAPPLLAAPRRNGTNFEFNLPVQSNRVYRIQTSTNLTNWVTWRTVSNAAGNVLIRDTNAPPPGRFYRAVTP